MTIKPITKRKLVAIKGWPELTPDTSPHISIQTDQLDAGMWTFFLFQGGMPSMPVLVLIKPQEEAQ